MFPPPADMPMHEASEDLSHFVNLPVRVEIQLQKGQLHVASGVITASNNEGF